LIWINAEEKDAARTVQLPASTQLVDAPVAGRNSININPSPAKVQ
jgi:hypothetical protein